MATYTENYNLEKPAQSDLYNIDVFNENADKIDEALGGKAANQSLAPIESSATASRNYSVGQQFVYNGLLYEATSAIASGGTITPGTNCARTTVAEELKSLNDSLTNRTRPTDTVSLTSNGLTLRYRCIGSILFFDLIGIPTSASVVAEFTVPTTILGYYQRVIQWGDDAKLMDIWVDSSSNKLRARNYNTLGVRASGSFLTNL